ncbi:MAG: hypothetical protein L3J81_04155, partial [Thermoplasmata archaeon]|nr:hypothetical protein [Thermoplasmata archaeon]
MYATAIVPYEVTLIDGSFDTFVQPRGKHVSVPAVAFGSTWLSKNTPGPVATGPDAGRTWVELGIPGEIIIADAPKTGALDRAVVEAANGTERTNSAATARARRVRPTA